MKQVLVTGATGFLGKYVVRQLAETGIPVVATDLRIGADAERHDNVTYVQCDVRDLRRVLRMCAEHNVDRVIHLASLLAPASQADPYTCTEVNVLGTRLTIVAAVQLGFSSVTWASSQAVFGHVVGNADSALTEHTPHHPDNAYGWAKSYCEGISLQYRSRYGINIVGLRIAMLYGAGKERGEGKFTEHLFDRPAKGMDSVVPFGDDTFSWQYVGDVAAAFIQVAQRDSTAEAIYNIPGRRATISEVADVVRTHAPGVTIELEPGVLGFPYNFSDDAYLRLVDGDYEMTSLSDGIEITLKSIARESQPATEGALT